MSKARPHAHIYEKWVRGIRQAVPDEGGRCALYEYIFAYQFARVYGATEIPNAGELSHAAALAFAMLEGDLDELCEARKENNNRRRENGLQSTPNSTEQPLAGASRPLQSNTIQSNTIQSNSNTIAKQALECLADASICIFDLGLCLLRKGYIVQSDRLQSVYERARKAKSPIAYAEKAGFNKLADPSAGVLCANFVEATKCRDTNALELYGVQVDADVLIVRCTAAARRAIGTTGTANAKQYAAAVGASDIRYLSNGE